MAKVKEPKEHPEQQHIEGMEPVRNPKIHAAAQAYKRVRNARMRATEAETAGKEKLIETMEEEGCEVYSDPSGYIVTVNNKRNVRLQDEERGGKADEE